MAAGDITRDDLGFLIRAGLVAFGLALFFAGLVVGVAL